LKDSTNVKIAMQCFENFGGGPISPNAPTTPGCATASRSQTSTWSTYSV